MVRFLGIAVLFAWATIGCGHARPPSTGQPDRLAIVAIDGRAFHPLDPSGRPASVILFVLQDCPICNGYAPRVQRLASQYSRRGVSFYLVHVDPTLSDAEAAAHAKEYGYRMPVLVDRRHELVSRLGIVAVPTAVVLGPDGAMRYKGRIDNRYFALGKSREAATTSDLRTALDAVIEHKPLKVASTKVIGCAVPDLPKADATRAQGY